MEPNREKGSKDFLEQVYHKGLSKIIQGNPKVQKGRFGKTTLLYDVYKERTFLRFECLRRDFGHMYVKPEDIAYAGFLVDRDGNGNPALFLNGCATTCDLFEKMFRDVIAHWPQDFAEQKASFSPVVQ